MERDEFLKTLGISFAMVCAGSCFQSCGKKGGDDTGEPNPGTGSNKVSVDISTMASVGSQKVLSGVLFFRLASESSASSFVATEAICPHEGGNLAWQPNNTRIQCDNHLATFSNLGAVLSGPVGGGSVRALKIYPVTLTGTTLTATKS